MKAKPDIFISYSKPDINRVNEIVDCIESYGFNCWFQQHNSKQDFTDAIIKGINESKAFLVFLSSSSIHSLYVRNEIKLAAERAEDDPTFKILPIFVEELDTKSESFKKLCLFIGSLNMLYDYEYKTTNELVLKIFDQLDFEFQVEEVRDSIYDGSSDVEKQRIAIQNKLFNKYANKHLDDLFAILDNPNVLDVGCSDADNILLRLNGRKYNHLVGIDINEAKIAEAKLKEDERHHFLALDVTRDDFISNFITYLWKINVKGFDIIHISSVLLHLKDPLKVLKDLSIFLNEGGYIFIQDEDDGVNMAYPNSSFFDNCFYIWDHSIESGDRKMGRKLPALLKQAGFKNIDLKSTTISSVDYGDEGKEALWDLYFNSDYWDTTDASYFNDTKAGELLPIYKSQHAKYREEYMNGNIFITLGIFFFTAKK